LGSNPLKLPFVFDCEGSEVAVPFVDGHLPESEGEVYSGEDGATGPSYVGDAFGDLFHGVLVHLGFGIEAPEILHNSQSLSVLLGYTENGRVIEGPGAPYHTEL
jgi:hypothetical protein